LRVFALVTVMTLAVAPFPAGASEFQSCWVTKVINPDTGFNETVTRCRIAGGDTVDYASDSSVPSVLSPNLGSDDTGPCWFLTSAPSPYIVITRYADGSADIGYDPDPSSPGGVIVVGPNLRRCTSEPTPAVEPATDAWNYVISYVHEPPAPDLNPEPGEGVTGLATFVGVPIPDDHSAIISSGLSTIEVEIGVDAVIVAWGDGSSTTYPPDRVILAGYPDGSASHVYEVKDPEGATITVEYDWTARWRLVGGSWTPLPVPNTDTTVLYPIAEVVSRLSD
jgi:hypothetical protein